MSRWKAFAIHLGLSVLIATVVLAGLLLIWSPPPLFSAAGVERFIYILIGVDVVLGPLLTLIVFRAGKPGLKLDLGLIALCQVAALSYGLHVMWQSRPVFLVATADRITMVAPIDIDAESQDRAAPEYRGLPAFGPLLVGGRTGRDSKERGDLVLQTLQTGKDIHNLPEYYVPYAQAVDTLLQRSRPLQVLLEQYPEASDRIQRFVRQHGGETDKLRFVPFATPFIDISAVLDSDTGAPLGYIALDPWFNRPPAGAGSDGDDP